LRTARTTRTISRKIGAPFEKLNIAMALLRQGFSPDAFVVGKPRGLWITCNTEWVPLPEPVFPRDARRVDEIS
jgi:hypothetical protein